MSTEIGQVNVSLRLSMAQFKSDVKEGASVASAATKQMADEMGGSVMEARGSLMLLSEEVGVHLPRHLQGLIAQIPGVGAAFAAMLPIVGVVAAIGVIEKLVAAHNAAKEAMLTAMAEIGAKDATVLGDLNEKLNQSKLKLLELADDGAGVLASRLDSLSHDTLTNLVGAFDTLGKSVEDVLKKMGSEGMFARILGLAGASDSLKNLQNEVLNIRASNASDEDKAASIGQKIEWYKNKAKSDMDEMLADKAAAENAPADAPAGGNFTDKQITEQQKLFATLNDMSKANATIQQKAAADTSAIQIEAADKATKEEEKIWLARNTEYQRSLKADEVAQDEAYKLSVSNIQESEKLKIDATHKGTQERLDAVLAAIKDEEAHGLQDTAYYKSLEEEKVKTTQAMADQVLALNRKLYQEMGKAQQGMIALSMAASKEDADFQFKIGTMTADERIDALKKAAQVELDLERQKNADMLAEMSENDPDYPLALQKRLDADAQAQAKYEQQMVTLDHNAVELRKQAWDAGFNQMNSGMTTLVDDLVKGNASISADVKKMLESMLTSWVNYFIQLEAKALEASIFMKALGILGMVPTAGNTATSIGSGGFGGQQGGGIGSVPVHAEGGHMSANELGIVGDAGPEVWHPDSAGSVIPMDKLTGKGGDTNNTANVFHFHGVNDFDSFKENQNQLAAKMYAAMSTAARRKG